MCIAVPAKIESITEDIAVVNYGGVKQKVCIALVEEINIGDYVLIHSGFAIEKLLPEEAAKTLEVFKDLAKVIDGGKEQ